jgi:hypothetical protein
MSFVTSSSIPLIQGLSLFHITGHLVTLTQYSLSTTLTINVPVVYMARDEMCLMRTNPFRGLLEGVGPESRLFWALKWQRAKRAPFRHLLKSGVPVAEGILSVANIPAVAGMS